MVMKIRKLESCQLFRRNFYTFSAISFSLLIVSCAVAPAPVPENQVSSLAPQHVEEKTSTIPLSYPKNMAQRFHPGLPLATFISENFIGSGHCGLCHGHLKDDAGNDMSINSHWRSTMMANASKDPLWQAKVASEVSRNPAVKQVIEQKCVTCHMPMAWAQAIADQEQYKYDTPTEIFDTLLNNADERHNAAMDGVSCSLCHQIQDIGLGTEKTFSGKFVIDTATSAPDRKIFGPYKDIITTPMRTSIGFTPEYGPHTNDSALCATCHTLYTPYLDAKGNVAGIFPEQTAYLEWLHSEYGEPKGQRHEIGETLGKIRICQECHMPHSPAGGVMIAYPDMPEAKKKDHFSRHHFVGGNVFMLNILQDRISPLGITASTEKLEDTKLRTLNQLQSDTALISILGADLSGGTLTATLQVTNKVGHKFPTGFPSRRAWLHFVVIDSADEVVFESGRPREDGSVTGDNADENMTYEPHYDRITQPDQVQIYEAVMHNTDGGVTYTLLRGAGYIKDNRLLPAGFDKNTAHRDIAPYGIAATDSNFVGGSDKITYEVKVGGHKGPFTVRAELFYSPLSYSFMEDLREDETLELVNRFATYYDGADKAPVTVDVLVAEVK